MLFEIWELIFFIFLPPPDVAQLILMYLGNEQFIAKMRTLYTPEQVKLVNFPQIQIIKS